MSEYAWFKLLVRAVGLLLMGLSLPGLLWAAGEVITLLFEDTPGMSRYWMRFLPTTIHSAAELAIGAYLFFGGEQIIARCLREVRGHCASCGYDLSATSTGVCPECGAEFKPLSGPPGTPPTPPH
jgi:hypothetical protein